ncbi:MAG: AMP-binding protein [Lachnospiraceae bacterium]|nr:AMP-binding protein [Lachnospiraceae bacterium]
MWRFEEYADSIAAVDEHKNQISYHELFLENCRLVERLKERCLTFILCSNTIGALIGYTTCINHHVVPLLLAEDMDKDLLEQLIKTYQPDYLWVPVKLRNAFENYSVEYEVFAYVLLKTEYQRVYRLNEKLCLLLTTSGSTGSPKLVRQSYENVVSNAQSIVQYLELNETERPITTLPMNYTYGLSIINSHLLVGATILFTEKGLMQKEFWRFFREVEATSFGGVPYTYEMLDKLRFYRMDLPSLRSMTQAGGKLQPELHKRFAEYAQKKGKRFYVMYGQAEATARMSYLPYDKSLGKYGSMGIAIPGGRFSVIDADGNEIRQPDTAGELVYEGPNVTLGYAECGEDLAKGDERHGRLETGDMARFDSDGYYYIVGRKKRFLKIFGNRVNLDGVDRLVKAEFGNIDCASAGRDDKLVLFITEEGLKEDIRAFLSQKTGLNSIAFAVHVIPEIPRNASGKVLYQEFGKYIEE